MNNYMDMFIKTKADYRDFIKEFYTETRHMAVFQWMSSLWLGDRFSLAQIPTIGLDWVDGMAGTAVKLKGNKLVPDDGYESERDAKYSGVLLPSMIDTFGGIIEQAETRNTELLSRNDDRLLHGGEYNLARLAYSTHAQSWQYWDGYNERGPVHPYIYINRSVEGAFPPAFEFYGAREFSQPLQNKAVSIKYHPGGDVTHPIIVALKMPIRIKDLDDIHVVQQCTCCDGSGWEVVE